MAGGGGGGGQQQGGADNSLAPLWIMVIIFITGLLIWYFAHDQIVRGVFFIKYYEAWALSFVVSSMNEVLPVLSNVDISTVTFEDMMSVSTLVGEVLRYPVIAILVVYGVICYRSDTTSQYRKVFDMDALKKVEAQNWPQIMPVLNIDLVNEKIDQGPWAMASNPLEFAIKHRILKKEIILTESKGRKKREGRYGIQRAEAKRVFTMQLGDYWENIESQKPHVQALFAIFAAKLCKDRAGSAALARQINLSTGTNRKVDFSGVPQLLKKHINAPEVKKIISKHAYVMTVMATLLEKCRDDGVLPAAEFLWLKPVDRRLWFTLNGVGRQTPFTEVAGVYAHWVAEKELKRKCMVPMVDEAVKGLELAIQEIKYKPEDDEGVA